MKKALFAILAMILILILPLSISASGNKNIDNIIVKFSGDSSFTPEQQEIISQAVINGIDDSYTTYNLLCTLFGHKEATESITVIEHCVRDSVPRCLETIADVTACTRCEAVINMTVVTSYYINCCD